MYMYSRQLSKTNPFCSRLQNQKIASSKNYAPLSVVIQRAQQNPKSLSGDEWQQLENIIGSKEIRKIKAGEKTSWIPEFKGISVEFEKSRQIAPPIQAKPTGVVGNNQQKEEQVAKEINVPHSLQLEQQQPIYQTERELNAHKLTPMVQKMKEEDDPPQGAEGGVDSSHSITFDEAVRQLKELCGSFLAGTPSN